MENIRAPAVMTFELYYRGPFPRLKGIHMVSAPVTQSSVKYETRSLEFANIGELQGNRGAPELPTSLPVYQDECTVLDLQFVTKFRNVVFLGVPMSIVAKCSLETSCKMLHWVISFPEDLETAKYLTLDLPILVTLRMIIKVENIQLSAMSMSLLLSLQMSILVARCNIAPLLDWNFKYMWDSSIYNSVPLIHTNPLAGKHQSLTIDHVIWRKIRPALVSAQHISLVGLHLPFFGTDSW